MVKIAQRAFQGAGVVVDVRLKQSDILDFEAPAEQGVVVINPPYGVRLSHTDELASLYPKLGDWLKQRFAGWRAYCTHVRRPRAETHRPRPLRNAFPSSTAIWNAHNPASISAVGFLELTAAVGES